MSSIVTAFIFGLVIGLIIGAKLGWHYTLIQLGRKELLSRIRKNKKKEK